MGIARGSVSRDYVSITRHSRRNMWRHVRALCTESLRAPRTQWGNHVPVTVECKDRKQMIFDSTAHKTGPKFTTAFPGNVWFWGKEKLNSILAGMVKMCRGQRKWLSWETVFAILMAHVITLYYDFQVSNDQQRKRVLTNVFMCCSEMSLAR